MSNWINFSILWMLTGSPVAAAVILLLAYAIADWYAFGFLRGVAHAVADFHRRRRRAAAAISRDASSPCGGAVPALAGLRPRPRSRRCRRRARTLLARVRDRAALPETPRPHLGLARAPFAPAHLRGGGLLRDRARRGRVAALDAERARCCRPALEPLRRGLLLRQLDEVTGPLALG